MRSDEGIQATLRKLVSLLDRIGVRYHLTRGIASVVHEEPRLTQDIDVVVDSKRLIAVERDLRAANSRVWSGIGTL